MSFEVDDTEHVVSCLVMSIESCLVCSGFVLPCILLPQLYKVDWLVDLEKFDFEYKIRIRRNRT